MLEKLGVPEHCEQRAEISRFPNTCGFSHQHAPDSLPGMAGRTVLKEICNGQIGWAPTPKGTQVPELPSAKTREILLQPILQLKPTNRQTAPCVFFTLNP